MATARKHLNASCAPVASDWHEPSHNEMLRVYQEMGIDWKNFPGFSLTRAIERVEQEFGPIC